jgi:hypothetical protein
MPLTAFTAPPLGVGWLEAAGVAELLAVPVPVPVPLPAPALVPVPALVPALVPVEKFGTVVASEPIRIWTVPAGTLALA